MDSSKPQSDQQMKSESPSDTKKIGEIYDLDEAVLRAQGREAQLGRSFSWFGALGLAFRYVRRFPSKMPQMLIGVPLKYCQLLVDGQYHFTYIVAPERFRNIAAFIVGAINVIAWWVNTASGTIYTAISAFGICQFLRDDFVGTQWQVYLCYLLLIFLTLLPLFLIPQRYIENLTKASMFLSLLGFVLVVIVCLVMGKGHYEPRNLVEYHSTSGWSAGPGWLLGIGNGEYAFAAAGACVHIAEEIPQPSRKIPLVINLTILIGIFTLVPSIIAMTCVLQDMDAVRQAFLPSLELFYQATGSKTASVFLQVYLTILYYSCVPSQWITSSRMAWAFSRDNGLPFSHYWAKVDEKRGIPIRALLLSASFCAIYGLLYIASTQAFNSIINTAVLMLNITYTVPQGILVTCGRHKLPSRYYNLGIWGYAINAFSVLWLILSGIFFCFPTSNPPTINNMNYNSVVLCGIFGLVSFCWLERRKKFTGPVIDWEALNVTQAAA
ncbi:amino acid transporter [Penicillium brevicompactum]|uniref:Amino acid transporter n=1 Tax=Penicillium brevicompactum TaxID=5074 RepID=A0A9W9R1B9_PENBR|nr:amino acid transporter [Penicillium brevicompactum]